MSVGGALKTQEAWVINYKYFTQEHNMYNIGTWNWTVQSKYNMWPSTG